MTNVEINKQARLSQHFTLGELTKTSAKTADSTSPSVHPRRKNRRKIRFIQT